MFVCFSPFVDDDDELMRSLSLLPKGRTETVVIYDDESMANTQQSFTGKSSTEQSSAEMSSTGHSSTDETEK